VVAEETSFKGISNAGLLSTSKLITESKTKQFRKATLVQLFICFSHIKIKKPFVWKFKTIQICNGSMCLSV
jgi:hypothetical protein